MERPNFISGERSSWGAGRSSEKGFANDRCAHRMSTIGDPRGMKAGRQRSDQPPTAIRFAHSGFARRAAEPRGMKAAPRRSD
jgi:hypothetical protein